MANLKLSPRKAAEGMIDAIARRYSYLAVKQREFEQAKSILLPGVKRVTNYESLRRLAQDALSRLHDGHVRIIDDQGKEYPTFRHMPLENFDSSVTNRYLSNIQRRGPITLASLDDIVYVCIDSFNSRERDPFEWLKTKASATQKKYIVDLRANGGGNDNICSFLAPYMLGVQGPVISSYARHRINQKKPGRLSEFVPRYVMPNPLSFKRQVVVLIGGYTCSAAELITLDLAAIPGTILIGDVSGGLLGCSRRYLVDGPCTGDGIGHDGKPKDYHSRFGLDIPSLLQYGLNQVLIQNNGINPHILIKPQDSIVGSKDCVLERAIEVHKKGYIAR